MSGAGADNSISQYFQKGARIEISSNDDGFRGAWYAGTLIRPPKGRSGKVVVEYDTLTEDEGGTRPLREVVDVVQIRPLPPRESRIALECDVDVDAYFNDGWWEGVVTGVLGEDKYKVYFRGTREEIAFVAPELRLHREWVHGNWVPPLEEPPDVVPAN